MINFDSVTDIRYTGPDTLQVRTSPIWVQGRHGEFNSSCSMPKNIFIDIHIKKVLLIV